MPNWVSGCAGNGAPMGRWASGAERGGKKDAVERRGDVAVGGSRDGGFLSRSLPPTRLRRGGEGCGAEGARGRRDPRRLTERPCGLPERSVAMEPGGPCLCSRERGGSLWGRAGSLSGGNRRAGGFIRASSVVRPQLLARWKEDLGMRCTMWPFINLGWPKTEVLCIVGVMWKTVETGLKKNLTRAFILSHNDGGRSIYSGDQNTASQKIHCRPLRTFDTFDDIRQVKSSYDFLKL